VSDGDDGDADDGLPVWFTRDVAGVFGAGIASVFLLHGDVQGLFANPDAAEEPDRRHVSLIGFCEKVFDTGKLVVFYDVASGMRFLRPEMERALLALDEPARKDPVAAAKAGLAAKRGLPREPELCLPLLEKALRAQSGVAIVIESVHHVAPTTSAGIPLPPAERANIQRLVNWAKDDRIRARKNLVLLTTDQAAKVSGELRLADGGIPPVFIAKPDDAARASFLAASGFATGDCAELSRASQGLSLRQLRDVLLRAKDSLDATALKQKKREILNTEYGDVMEVVEPSRGLDDIGGCDHIKRYFAQVLEGIKSGDARLVPMGVTLMGPPGTGKTAIVEALAREAGFNFVKTKNVRSMWVGESEARMEKLCYGLQSLAPVVVMNDEADLAEGGRDSARGDSGVSERLMKMWMELLSNPRIRGKIIVINCTNRPDRIDPALKRSGRSDERILMPMPSETERAQILAVQFRRHDLPTDIVDWRPFARATGLFSGADLERLALSAYRIANERGATSVDATSLDLAIADFIPSASQAEIDAMTILGLGECSSRRLLPPNVDDIVTGIQLRGLVPDLEIILARLAARNVIGPTSNLTTGGDESDRN
jgi:ATP-dependent 26S proteasome regulatory subunit